MKFYNFIIITEVMNKNINTLIISEIEIILTHFGNNSTINFL